MVGGKMAEQANRKLLKENESLDEEDIADSA